MKILFATTSANALDPDHRTGLWLEEFADPFTMFGNAGYSVVVASPKGGTVPLDPKTEPTDADRKKWPEALAALKNTRRLADMDSADFDALFIPGGHGPLIDLVNDPDVQRLVAQFDGQGRIIASVCHGPAALLNARGADGQWFLKGRQVTGFTNLEERLALKHDVVPFLLEDELRARGAKFGHALVPFTSHVVRDGNLITGQNPASSERVAESVIQVLEARGGLQDAHP